MNEYQDQDVWFIGVFACDWWELETDFDTREDAELVERALRAEFPDLLCTIRKVRGQER